jgi:hypothetical protein
MSQISHAVATLLAVALSSPSLYAFPSHPQPNHPHNGYGNNGQTNPGGITHGAGNNGNGVGNVCCGNQGSNGKDVGHAAGSHGKPPPAPNWGNGEGPGYGDDGQTPRNPPGGDDDPQKPPKKDAQSPNDSQKKNDNKVKMKVLPIAYLDLNVGSRMVRLPIGDDAGQENAMLAVEGAMDAMSDYKSGGYRVIHTRSIDLGVGAAVSFTAQSGALAYGGPFVGLMPLVGGQMVSDRYVAKQADAKKLPEPVLPTKAGDISKWPIGDKVCYQGTHGIIAVAGAFGVAGFGGHQWDGIVCVERTVRGGKIYQFKGRGWMIGAGAGVIVANVGVTATSPKKERSETLSFDFSNEDAVTAFADTIAGKPQAAREMAYNNYGSKTSAVVLEESVNGTKIRKSANFFLGLPILLHWSGSKGTTTEKKTTLSPTEGKISYVEMATYQKEVNGRAFFKNRNKSIAFTGADFADSNGGDEAEQSQLGVFKWKYANDLASGDALDEQRAELVTLTGFYEELAVVPIPQSEGSLGYASLGLTVKFSPDVTNLFISYVQTEGAKRNLLRIVGNQLADLFYDIPGNTDPKKLKAYCQETRPSDADERCFDLWAVEGWGPVDGLKKDALKALAEMDKTQGRNKTKFVKAYSQFGKAMMANKVMFQALMRATGGLPVVVSIDMEGEKITPYHRDHEWSAARAKSMPKLPAGTYHHRVAGK